MDFLPDFLFNYTWQIVALGAAMLGTGQRGAWLLRRAAPPKPARRRHLPCRFARRRHAPSCSPAANRRWFCWLGAAVAGLLGTLLMMGITRYHPHQRR
jgi:hypothetical protein